MVTLFLLPLMLEAERNLTPLMQGSSSFLYKVVLRQLLWSKWNTFGFFIVLLPASKSHHEDCSASHCAQKSRTTLLSRKRKLLSNQARKYGTWTESVQRRVRPLLWERSKFQPALFTSFKEFVLKLNTDRLKEKRGIIRAELFVSEQQGWTCI